MGRINWQEPFLKFF